MFGGPDGIISDCAILEVSPSDGSVVNRWLASNHFITKEVTTTPSENGTAADGGTIVDVYHCNAIDIDPANNNLLISMRNANTVIYMTWPEGDILWKMGGVNQSNNNAPFVTVSTRSRVSTTRASAIGTRAVTAGRDKSRCLTTKRRARRRARSHLRRARWIGRFDVRRRRDPQHGDRRLAVLGRRSK
jgi:hypothetical protein